MEFKNNRLLSYIDTILSILLYCINIFEYIRQNYFGLKNKE